MLKTGRPRASLAFVLDILCVFLFVFLGRNAHGESLLGGFVTAIPFVAATVLAWLLPVVQRTPYQVWPAGLTVWLAASLGGQALRLAFAAGSALSFVIVTVCVTGFLLLGWRLVVLFTLKFKRARSKTSLT
ncbi:MAG: DUF3054 domain-containing protein [Rothia sp. (in: high G+C Gram-positive bacteria)]|nr:DUF3054 domain-containing protein [Rothia sp. (in: high G+C Gram-positive bacteria)]